MGEAPPGMASGEVAVWHEGREHLMPVLPNARHERFAQEIAKGTEAGEAYKIAGFKPNPGNARRLKLDEAVKKRVEAILSERSRIHEKGVERAIERTALTKEWVIGRLVENVERAMQAEAVKDREGNEIGEYAYQGSVANKALELLGKELGMFVERTENVNVNHDVSDRPLSEDEWAAQHTKPH